MRRSEVHSSFVSFILHMTRLTRAFSVSFTTGPFGPSRIRLFGASPYRVDSRRVFLHLSYSMNTHSRMFFMAQLF